MSVELTPQGTRGGSFPKWLRPIMKVFAPLGNAMMRRSGTKLLEITTTGARSGLQRTVTVAWFPMYRC